jgi:hypothetical protein
MTLLAALAIFPQQQPVALTLAVDTYLDRKSPDGNAGREPFLMGGTDKAVLVRFPDLGIKIGMGKRVKSAKLVMGLGRPGAPNFASIERVLTPWNEGGGKSVATKAEDGGATWRRAVASRDGLGWEKDGAAGQRDAEPIPNAQASLAEDVLTVTGLEAAVQAMVDRPEQNYGFRLAFSSACAFFSADSLAPGPQLVVEFEDAAAGPGVDLQALMCEPDPSLGVGFHNIGLIKWVLTVRNAGEQPSETQSLVLTAPGREPVVTKLDAVIAPGASRTVTFDVPQGVINGPGLGRTDQSFTVRIEPSTPDKAPGDNGIVVYPFGLEVSVSGVDALAAQQAVTDLNARVFPCSKFGAWPTGCTERLRLGSRASVAAKVGEGGNVQRAVIQAVTGLPDSLVRPYVGDPPMAGTTPAPGFVSDVGQVGLLPDTRDDILVPRDFAIPARGQTTTAMDVPMNEWGMLSRSEVTVINSQVGKQRGLPWDMTPTAVFFTVFTPDGPVPPGSKLEVYQTVAGAFGSQPVFTADLNDGTALMPPRPGGTFGKSNPLGDLQKDGTNGWLLAVVRTGGSVSATWVSVMQLWDEYARGNKAAAFIQLRAQAATGPLDTSQNLALERLVTDAKGRFPAELNALVDGKNETSLALGDEGDGYWIDIDLGRDRPIGQVQIVFDGPVWRQFRIVTYKTAQTAADSQVWSEESNGPANTEATKTEDGKTVLSYSAKWVRSRFVRIVPLSHEAVKLAEVRVVPIQT